MSDEEIVLKIIKLSRACKRVTIELNRDFPNKSVSVCAYTGPPGDRVVFGHKTVYEGQSWVDAIGELSDKLFVDAKRIFEQCQPHN